MRFVAHYHVLAAIAALTAMLPCQVNRTAHPQETTEAGSGSVLPFGCLGPTVFTDVKTQILIRSQELPGPGATLVGFEVHCQNATMVDYTSLEVDVSPTTVTSLSPIFASNITGPVTAVLRARDLRVFFNPNGWKVFHLQSDYVHDGMSGLLIEVRKIVDPTTAQFATMSTTSSPVRSDLPPMACSSGGPGSGASTAATAQATAPPLSVRLIWTAAPTVRLLSDAAPSGNQFGLGGTVDHTVDAAPGTLAASLVGDSFLVAPVLIPPIFGRILIQGSIFNVTTVPSSGHAQFQFGIPANNGLIGLYLTYQSVIFDPATGRAELTNGIDHFINP